METIKEMQNTELSAEDVQLFSKLKDYLAGKEGEPPQMNTFLASPSAAILVPRVIVGQAREAAEPKKVASRFFRRVRLPNSGATAMVILPIIGTIRAFEVGEGQEIREQTIDVAQAEQGVEVYIRKVGVRLGFTREAQNDSLWDVLGYNIDAAGRALARKHEERALREMVSHAHVVFDNAIRAEHPEAGTTGRDENGNFNDTFSVEDFLDTALTAYANEVTPTDVVMHPLAWTVWIKNDLTGGMGFEPIKNLRNGIQLGPEAVAGRLPAPFTVNFTPYGLIDLKKKTYDIMFLDRDRVGVYVEKEGLRTENWQVPERDLTNIQLTERYGYAVVEQGRGIMIAKNIKMDKTYPLPPMIRTISA